MKPLLNALGQVSAIIGAQWGDEGKGKITDMLAEEYDVIARACGGANAGHTIVVKGKKHVFHLLPSGCLHDGKIVFLGSGMVLHLPTLIEEIQTLKVAGIDILPRLYISSAAHILFEYHKDIDSVLEDARSKGKGGKIGTTKRGIGPAYMEKAERAGVRMESLDDEKHLREHLEERTATVKQRFNVEVDSENEMRLLSTASELLASRIAQNGPAFLADLYIKKKSILVEGAQATLLDIDHGTYPFVTSSSTSLAGALQGIGLAPRALTSCIGVAKAYCTRVGSGDFPAEADEERANRLRERGGEYGATTGRSRRCGWLSIPDLQFGALLNGFTHWNITKLDVLDEEEVIPVHMGNGFEELPGWQSSTVGMTEFSQLPKNAQRYIEFIEKHTNVPVTLIGTGQGREEMIVRMNNDK